MRALDTILRDPRHFQIAVVGSLLIYGIVGLDFGVGPIQVVVLLSTALLAQWGFCRGKGLPFDARSPLISGLSLCLLARSNSLWLLALAAVVTIAGKFLIRRRGKHVFNPTNFGLVFMMVAADGRLWVSPGQWGQGPVLTLLIAWMGIAVVHRAARSDVSWAFLAAYVSILLARGLWLGDPLPVTLHALESGALLIFAFFMISDPKTTPDSRAGRLVYAVLVALGAAFVHFALFRPNGFLWSLVCLAPIVPRLDRVLPGRRYRWRSPSTTLHQEVPMPHADRTLAPIARLALTTLFFLGLSMLAAGTAHSFCGFYVAKADTKLFNRASQVVLARAGDRTVITMANDFKGDPREFAVVIPVPTFLEREQIHVADQSLIDHLDAYTSPRLVEYFDENPCLRRELERRRAWLQDSVLPTAAMRVEESDDLGVTIEATYTVGEYDILILSAEESEGLETWLRGNGYRLPEGASPVLGSYLRQGMRFFVAKVNLDEQAALGYTNLRPLQVAFESPKFMLPIRLGTVNADGPQELFVYALTRRGRVETTNYRTVELPSGQDVPVFVKDDFGDFYRDLFKTQMARESHRAVFLEYAWDMGWCDPCAADPLSPAQLLELGAFWIDPDTRGQARDAFVTRLHVRYDSRHFPQDLVFQETGNRENFQGRYVLRHAWTGTETCPEAESYRAELPRRWEREAQTLANLTGWPIADIRRRIGYELASVEPVESESWWKRLWSRQ